MIVKEAVYEKKMVEQTVCVSQEVNGCDECGVVINGYPNEEDRLDMTVFYHEHDKESDRLHFCSWDCVLNHLPKIQTDYFVSLPYVSFDRSEESKKGATRLIQLLQTKINPH